MDPHELSGNRLDDGWTLERRRDISINGTGACHSVGYVARHDNGAVGFVKVLDTRIDRYTPDPLDDLQLSRCTSAFYFRDRV